MSGYSALRSSAAWFDVSPRGKIRLTGEDRARLLHAMSTNDVKDLPPGHGVYAFFLNDKGRILSDSYIYHLTESFLLDTEPETARLLFDHLDKYIIADDVTLADETATLGAVALEGPDSLAAAEKLGLPIPGQAYAIRPTEDGFVAKVSVTGLAGIRVFLPEAVKAAFVEWLTAAGVPEATAEEVRTVRLENGTPRFGEDISERYLVQETQLAHAVHANKGCYLGQEIVERVRSRGQVHRLLTPLRIAGTVAPAGGTKLLAAGQTVGEITSAVYSPEFAEVAALAYVRQEALVQKQAMVVAESDPPAAARVAELVVA